MNNVDYGPLENLIGSWFGSKGIDISPEPDGTEKNSYNEELVFTALPEIKNAEEQILAVLHYTQSIKRNVTDKPIHHETGYWMWDKNTNAITHSISIPRSLTLLAGGTFSPPLSSGDPIILNVFAEIDHPDWGIIQSPFLKEKGKTLSFSQRLTITRDQLSYTQSTLLDIYGKRFDHTDENTLKKV